MKHFTIGNFKKLTLAAFLSLGLVGLSAYGQTYEWTAQNGGAGDDFGTSVTSDDAGNVYSCGYFNSDLDLDPGAGMDIVSSPGLTDMFVTKLDATGSYLWGHSFSSTQRNRAESITIDNDDNIYVTGYFEGTVDFDPGSGLVELTSVGDRDVFILKLDTDGNFLWVKHFGGNGASSGLDINFARDNNIYTTGFFGGNFIYEPTAENIAINSLGSLDGYVFGLDTAGNLLHNIHIPSDGVVVSFGVDIDCDGNIYAGGYFGGDLQPGDGNTYTAAGSTDTYVLKYDNTGASVWTAIGTGASNNRITGLRVGEENVYFSGYFQDDLTFDDGTTTINLNSVDPSFDLLKGSLTTMGEINWIYSFGGVGNDLSLGLRIDNQYNLFTTGYISNTVNFDPSGTFDLTSSGGNNAFIHKLNKDGGFEDAFIYDAQFGFSLHLADNWDLYISGYFSGTEDLEPGGGVSNFTSLGGIDAYYSKFNGNCTAPDAPTLVEAANDLCPNTTTTIDITAGNLNDATDWVWYTDDCFTDSVFAGTSFTTPSLTDTVTYYVRGEGACVVGTSEVTINVADNDAPVVVANDFTIGTDAGACEATSVDLGESITDNCALNTTSNDAPSVFPTGLTTVTWTVTDESGNETIHVQEVTVEDQEAPVADAAMLSDIVELCEVTSLTAPTATDNCDGSIVATSDATLPITSTSTITWTYEDANGNTSTQQQEVIIQGVDVSTSVNGIELTANNSTIGVDYQWIDCNDNDAPIVGASNQVYTPTQNGSYAVILLENGCQDTSACIDVTTVGLEEFSESNINVFPNPSAGEFNIELASLEALNYTVSDNTGRIVLEGTFEKLENTIDLSTEEQGVYFLRVDGNVLRLIVQ